jgi:hypothetical protein
MRKKNNTTQKEKQESLLEEDMKRHGYLLPTNEDELAEFEKMYGNTPVTFPEHLKEPDFLFKKKEARKGKVIALKPTTEKTKSQNDYFKKVVLAAEIACQLHEEPTFGHIKFVKIFFVCKEVCEMKLNTSFAKHAAGPLDPKLMYSIDKEFEKQKWFKKVKRESYGFKYVPLENMENYKTYYSRYYANQKESIDRIISLFRKEKSDFCEKVATLFAVWKENFLKNNPTDEPTLFKAFYAWDKSKARFTESELVKAMKWMEENEIVPAN